MMRMSRATEEKMQMKFVMMELVGCESGGKGW